VSAVNAWRLRMCQTGHKEPFLNFLRELCNGMLTEHSTKPVRRRSVVGNAGETRFDNLGSHWIVSTEEDAAGKAKRRNCKMCHLKGKADLKTVYMCEKFEVPLHTHCFSRTTQRVLRSRKYFFWLPLRLQLQLLLCIWWFQLQLLRGFFFRPQDPCTKEHMKLLILYKEHMKILAGCTKEYVKILFPCTKAYENPGSFYQRTYENYGSLYQKNI
jgi:hypothetical protein